MTIGIRVGCCVLFRRVVAARNVATLETDPKVEPERSGRQAILTAGHRLREPSDPNMGAMPAPNHALSQ